MKTNHQRDFKDDQSHEHTFMKKDILDKQLEVEGNGWDMVHHGPGEKCYRRARKGTKRAGHQKVRAKVRDFIIEEIKDLNTDGPLQEEEN
jgi:hypothetical protein